MIPSKLFLISWSTHVCLIASLSHLSADNRDRHNSLCKHSKRSLVCYMYNNPVLHRTAITLDWWGTCMCTVIV